MTLQRVIHGIWPKLPVAMPPTTGTRTQLATSGSPLKPGNTYRPRRLLFRSLQASGTGKAVFQQSERSDR